MTEVTLDQGRDVATSTHWVRRSILVIFCLGLLAAIGAVFTQVIAARVPEQRATLEKLITDRTGLAVRFDNVHFAWGIDGTSAVFERVELTDPTRGRVRVIAPELRVEFDTWDFLRHQQFSLGHVTLSSPDIDIIGDAEPDVPVPARASARNAQQPSRAEDEAALVRRFTAWAELMPVGRVEVEGARVHLYRRGERAARHNFTLSQALVSRGSHNFSAFGTLLLSQDIGQSLFVSAKLDRVGDTGGVDGELRVIARRVFLDKLSAVAARGRGTVDARLSLRHGRIHDGTWQLSARELQLARGTRFDHFTVQGKLARVGDDFDLEFTDLQLTRGARLERAPKLAARVSLARGTMRPARITASAERVPFMAAEFIAGALAPRLEMPLDASGWAATAGELSQLRFDSRTGAFTAQVTGAELLRAADHARVGNLAGILELEGEQARVTFDASHAAQLQLGAAPPRDLRLAGALSFDTGSGSPELDIEALRLQSGDTVVGADGRWGTDGRKPLLIEVTALDRSLLGDAWTLLALDPLPHLADLHEGRIVTGKLTLQSKDDAGSRVVDWPHSRGSLELADLASTGADVPRLLAAGGKLDFTRGGAQLRLTTGAIEDLQITDARIDWPRIGAPRLRASAQGDLRSPLLRRVLDEHGLDKLAGNVSLEAEARNEAALRNPESWRVTARLSNASLPLAADLPPVEKISGTVRLAAGELRGLELSGNWLGGPVQIETRRAGTRGITSASVNGVADPAPLLRLLGHAEAATQVNGQLAWSGELRRKETSGELRRQETSGAPGSWQLTLGANLAGVESRLPEPFDKMRARQIALTAQLHFDARGIQDFEIGSGRDAIRGRVHEGVTEARFDVQGVAGALRAGAVAQPRVDIDKLDLKRAPAVLAAAGALLPKDGDLVVDVAELRHANRALGALEATLARNGNGVEFSLESTGGSPHEVSATGHCSPGERCQMEFTVKTRELPMLLGDTRLPAEWPTQSLRASGELAWRGEDDVVRALTGSFELETGGADDSHQLMASAVLADGQIELTDVQGTGPEADQLFRGSGRVGLVARTYDVTIDYETVSLAASAVPTPARVRLSRAWSSLRGSVARKGWTETTPARRVQWHGSWE
ncbi:MAG TPA: DUF3971 domain-containing protein [Steroidobacteraceae bacterium]|nr:DUF3971 domain-containing protein [Steroidobacteraceae bacterium]